MKVSFCHQHPKGCNMCIQTNKQILIYKNIRAQAKQCFFVFCFYSSYRILCHPRQLVWFFHPPYNWVQFNAFCQTADASVTYKRNEKNATDLTFKDKGYMHKNELFNTTNSYKSSVIEYKIQKLKTTCPQSTLKLLRWWQGATVGVKLFHLHIVHLVSFNVF